MEEYYKNDKISEELTEQFVIHNKQAEDFVIRFSKEEKFNEKEKEIAVLAAILHDVAKGRIDFLKHGEEGGVIAEKLLIKMGISEKLAKSVRLGIERHMGQEGYPAEIVKKAYGEDFKYPKYATKVDQIIYECDILTQLTKEGFDKILLLRRTDKENIKEDKKIAEEKNIDIETARILSVLKSAKTSYDLIKMESVKKYADRLWREIQKKYKIFY